MRGATQDDFSPFKSIDISIHAPLAGCDESVQVALNNKAKFQSTHPLRGATSTNKQAPGGIQFQSTHPLRGATTVHIPSSFVHQYFNPRTPCGVRPYFAQYKSWTSNISIHAPLAGCDDMIDYLSDFHMQFQSTHPLRGATPVFIFGVSEGGISIHAPLAGCDCWVWSKPIRQKYFNPRTPCGVRQSERFAKLLVDGVFQSTHPLRGATKNCICQSSPAVNFNPRTPCGVRRKLALCLHAQNRFQSTHPLRGATAVFNYDYGFADISIHAPLAGCDLDETKVYRVRAISIHAPLAGCDGGAVNFWAFPAAFQSTHPLRGATFTFDQATTVDVFQSTHPLRGATNLRSCLFLVIIISIHAPLAGCDCIVFSSV